MLVLCCCARLWARVSPHQSWRMGRRWVRDKMVARILMRTGPLPKEWLGFVGAPWGHRELFINGDKGWLLGFCSVGFARGGEAIWRGREGRGAPSQAKREKKQQSSRLLHTLTPWMYYDKVGDRLKKNWEYKCEYKCVHRPIQFNTAACLLVYNVLYSLSVSHQVASAQQGRRCDLLTSCHTWANNTMLWMYNLTTRCLQIETILSKQQEQEQSKNWKRVLDTIMLLCPALRFVFLRWHNMIARGADLNLHFLLPTKLQMTTPYLSSFQNWSKQKGLKKILHQILISRQKLA